MTVPCPACAPELERLVTLLRSQADSWDRRCTALADEIAALREKHARMSSVALRRGMERDAARAEVAALRREVARLRDRLDRVLAEVEGYVDGSPDAPEVSRLANRVAGIVEGEK